MLERKKDREKVVKLRMWQYWNYPKRKKEVGVDRKREGRQRRKEERGRDREWKEEKGAEKERKNWGI